MTGGKELLKAALEALVEMGVILKAVPKSSKETIFFLNGPQGQAALKAIQEGKWQGKEADIPIHLTEARPNIFKLYEENIGAITPMISEILKEDERTYPQPWIEEAIRIAITHNARNWKYIQAILKRWKQEGRGYEQNRRDGSQDPNSYREGWGRHD
jgi:DnaD/phage-associated family protein